MLSELEVLEDVCARLEKARIEYMLTGSMAMTYYAQPRMTRDIDGTGAPGGGKRMVMPSRGVRYTIVNGFTTYADGELVGASAGTVLRS
jgi:N-acyl-D-aspartate/D-glutamate deacylase